MKKNKVKHSYVHVQFCGQKIILSHLVIGHLSEGSFVRNGVVQIPKFDAKPNPNLNLCLYVLDK